MLHSPGQSCATTARQLRRGMETERHNQRAYLFRTPPGPSIYLRESGTELIRSDGHDDHLTSFVLRSRMQHLSRFADYGALLRILQGRRGPAAMS